MRFIFTPPAPDSAGLLTLPWTTPLEEWDDPRLVTPRGAGLHRHVVRFVSEGGALWVVKELPEHFARREYRLLRRLADLGIPAVEVLGVAIQRGPDMDAALVTRYLDFSTTYRALFSQPRGLFRLDQRPAVERAERAHRGKGGDPHRGAVPPIGFGEQREGRIGRRDRGGGKHQRDGRAHDQIEEARRQRADDRRTRDGDRRACYLVGGDARRFEAEQRP